MLTVGKLIKKYCGQLEFYDAPISIHVRTNMLELITLWRGSAKRIPNKYKKYRVIQFLPNEGEETLTFKILIKHKPIDQICETCLKYRKNGCNETALCRRDANNYKWSWNGKLR